MSRSLFLGLALSGSVLVSTGCASGGVSSGAEVSGSPPARATSVRVFDAAPDVQCTYRTVGGVTGEITINEPSAIRTDIKRELGRLGARRGADAVIMAPDIEIPLSAAGGRDPVASLVGRKIEVRGIAIEYTEPCNLAATG